MRPSKDEEKKGIVLEGLCESLLAELAYASGQADAWASQEFRLQKILRDSLKIGEKLEGENGDKKKR